MELDPSCQRDEPTLGRKGTPLASTQPGRTAGLSLSRRRVLGTAAAGIAGAVGLAGCLEDEDPVFDPVTTPQDAALPFWDDLADMSGELIVYSGRTRDQIDPLFTALESRYPDLTIRRDYDGNEAQLNSLREEGENTPADVFYTQSSGVLAALKQDNLLAEIPADDLADVDHNYRDNEETWTGVSGRVRAIQYNTDHWSAEDLPEDIFAYANEDRFEGVISTRPNSGTFRSFIVAMLELEGEERTREWVRKMVEDQDITLYSSGSQQAQAVANGEQEIALGNQYYAGRIVNNDPTAPIDVAFTRGDPGSLFNVSGVGILGPSNNQELGRLFLQHVLAAEGQWFFIDVNGEYPVVDGIEYVGDLPGPDDVDSPEFDLNALADLEPAIDLLEEEGMVV